MEASSREVNGLLLSYIEIEVQINVEAKKLHCIREEKIEIEVRVLTLFYQVLYSLRDRLGYFSYMLYTSNSINLVRESDSRPKT